jgi:hypothetical protein
MAASAGNCLQGRLCADIGHCVKYMPRLVQVVPEAAGSSIRVLPVTTHRLTAQLLVATLTSSKNSWSPTSWPPCHVFTGWKISRSRKASLARFEPRTHDAPGPQRNEMSPFSLQTCPTLHMLALTLLASLPFAISCPLHLHLTPFVPPLPQARFPSR